MSSRYIPSNRCLDEECARIKQNADQYLKSHPAGSFTITYDGWTNIKKTRGKYYKGHSNADIFKAVETGDISHTGEYMPL